MKNVLQDQSYPMHLKSNLYDTFKERYNQKREAVVKFDAFVALLTIFGAICIYNLLPPFGLQFMKRTKPLSWL